MPRFRDNKGNEIALERELGRGGEGAVFTVVGNSSVVAKIYHAPPTSIKAQKLELMASQVTDDLTNIAAWPLSTIRNSSGLIVGITLPLIKGYSEVHRLYSPAQRQSEFPRADWEFLIQTARNSASAFENVHARGHVIGDVNQGNVVVSDRALAKLIDCDSFQINSGSGWFPCEVGVAHFTPPELQDMSFRGVIRTQNHDAFGLAVLIFHLLFMGRHPFAGRFAGTGDMPIERAIKESRFTFSHSAAVRHMTPPPHHLPLASASFPISNLFERAFASSGSRGNNRPLASEWVAALDDLRKELKICSASNAHKYHKSLSACPWCEIEKGGGPDFFISVTAVHRTGVVFNVGSVWSLISALNPPPANYAIPAAPPNVGRGTPLQNRAITIQRASEIVLALAIAFVASVFMGYTWIGFTLSGICIAIWRALTHAGDYGAERQKKLSSLSSAKKVVEDSKQRLSQESNGYHNRFVTRRKELERLKTEYQHLHTQKQQALASLRAKKREAQLSRFLEGFLIERASIQNFGAGRKALLASYGIETANDITHAQLQRVPGIGPALQGSLFAWRAQIENRFVFDPTRAIDPRDLAAIESTYRKKASDLENQLSRGPSELRQIIDSSRNNATLLQQKISHELAALAAAASDAKPFQSRGHKLPFIVGIAMAIVLFIVRPGQMILPTLFTSAMSTASLDSVIKPSTALDTTAPNPARTELSERSDTGANASRVKQTTSPDSAKPTKSTQACLSSEVCVFARPVNSADRTGIAVGTQVTSWKSAATGWYQIKLIDKVGYIRSKDLTRLTLPKVADEDSVILPQL